MEVAQKHEVKRTEEGKWVKGSVPNPGGRPRENTAAREFKALLAKDAKYLYDKCKQMLEDPEEKGKSKVLIYLIDRLCGKVATVVDVTTTENPLPSQMTGLEKAQTYLKWCGDKLGAEGEDTADVNVNSTDSKE